MEAEVKEAIVLLKNLEYQLKHGTYGDLNKFTDYKEYQLNQFGSYNYAIP